MDASVPSRMVRCDQDVVVRRLLGDGVEVDLDGWKASVHRREHTPWMVLDAGCETSTDGVGKVP